ncbi:MAG TPA: tetratricopeptide repeat protein [Lacunisphaera sp.]|nr:tetratricopeptide repeat protein [Lacunisphaera sp.]
MPPTKDTPNVPPDPVPPGGAKAWAFRLIMLLGAPALLLLALEGGLRLAGYGRPTGFLIPDEKPGYYRTNPDFTGFFLPRSFDLRPLNFRLPVKKPPGALRVVVLGESAAQGVPAPAFGFAPQLRALLRARYPGREIEVINTGIVAINSHVVYRVTQDLADFNPDVFIVYLGNNEVVGPYGPGSAFLSKMPPLWLIRLSEAVKFSRTGQLVAALLERLPRAARRAPAWDGMAMFVDNAVRGDDPRLDQVYRNFEANLRDIVRVATRSGARTILCTVVANLKDSAPFLSLHRPDLGETEHAGWKTSFERGRREWLLDEDAAARRDLEEALRIDPPYADTSYLLGTLELKAGHVDAARKLFVAALHWDALRFRPDPRLNEIVRQVAAEKASRVSLLDAARELGADPESPAPPAGREWLFEHVHFDWEGNDRLAQLLARAVEATQGARTTAAGPWLDSAGVARALAYTPHERLAVLRHNADIVRRPPFSNQMTYFLDQAKLAREMAGLEADGRQPANLRQAAAVTAAALAGDPDNPDLHAIAEGLALDAGDPERALAEARQAAALLPRDLALAGDEASLLSQLGRFDEAAAILDEAARHKVDPRRLVPMRAALEIRRHRYDTARAIFDRALADHPEDHKLRVMRGNLARIAGHEAEAEQEFRAILQAEPSDEDALEALVSLLMSSGRKPEAEQVSGAMADAQPRNQLNSLRAAEAAGTRGDRAAAVKYLLQAARCGPLPTGLEVSLARQLHQVGRDDESLLHLAQARRLAQLDGDADLTGAIEDTIRRLRSDTR